MPIYQLPENEFIFPDPREAEDGLIAVGGDLHPERVLEAYANGIFPWPSDDFLPWFSPDPRLVLFPEKFKVSKSLRQTIRNKGFVVRFDTNFEAVIEHCAHVSRKGQDDTWISRDIMKAYTALHKLGFVHSIEVYNSDNELVGGLYGVSLGKAFYGESMFALVSDASKVALFYLVEFAKRFGILFIDAQEVTSHLLSLGAEEIPRDDFLKLNEKALEYMNMQGLWDFDSTGFVPVF